MRHRTSTCTVPGLHGPHGDLGQLSGRPGREGAHEEYGIGMQIVASALGTSTG
ncbi:hypothetical protein [Nocardia sp. NPDC049707]|uniref:hypothetical protein n=1 Tax=Nocardia sp. NPDC049707 TaxID=3154735 RepID=UPI0034127176